MSCAARWLRASARIWSGERRHRRGSGRYEHIGYAAEKPSNPLTAQDRSAILAELATPDCPFEVVPVDAEIAARVAEVPREVNADPGDRVLVATTEVLGARLVSADRTRPAMTATTVIW